MNNKIQPPRVISSENLAFFKNRKGEVYELQDKIQNFFENIEKTAEANYRIFLSVNLSSYIFCKKEVAWDFFQIEIKSDSSRIKFEMSKMQIVYREFYYPNYTSRLDVKFFVELLKDNPNHPFLSCSLSSLAFEDSTLRFFERGSGNRVLDLFFYSSKDYFFVKKQILTAREELGL